MHFPYCLHAPLHHFFFLFYFANRKDEMSTEEVVGEPGESPVFSTGKLRSHFICF